ncbi:ligase-associated DNA damage response exonuclease [Chryseolinea lacunae]|uniref:Ligase-associated DNA damage response exonuclease n=1 Tax=Chryseolinea lacunae TaxID=2801331 RepID=A0ABS1KK33_9BACT|nr:ligase-associated DNA damage response exonuclease [Chryseolinea lacunae]MBL0739592.1 ligase-associated DNA damage response exonuclease [Chryseolinea lacunae]
MGLLDFTAKGIYCPAADVYLDPWQPVKKALITHGHADHARFGHEHYLCTAAAAPVIKYRLSLTDNVQQVSFGEKILIHGVQFSFHPAGHIPGSAQIRVEHRGEVWVFTGDYKLQHDNISEPFEPVKCHTFITESTFGLPIYNWKPQQEVFDDMNAWWRKNQEEGKVSIVAGYSLGKSQRILKNVDAGIGKILVHGAIENVTAILRAQGLALPPTTRVTPDMKRKDFEGALVVCPPSAIGSAWLRKFEPYSLGIASGWMGLRGARRRRGADRGFVLSDHCDWRELNQAVNETGAEHVFVTHGYSEIFAQWLNGNGKVAREVKTQYEGELGEVAEASAGVEDKTAEE